MLGVIVMEKLAAVPRLGEVSSAKQWSQWLLCTKTLVLFSWPGNIYSLTSNSSTINGVPLPLQYGRTDGLPNQDNTVHNQPDTAPPNSPEPSIPACFFSVLQTFGQVEERILRSVSKLACLNEGRTALGQSVLKTFRHEAPP